MDLQQLKEQLTGSRSLEGEAKLLRMWGGDWPETAETMIGHVRLDNLEECARAVFADHVPGDFLEAGVWRGGACIFLRALLDLEEGGPKRTVWAADSFVGLPPPNAGQYPVDLGDGHHTIEALRVDLNEVRTNFARYGLLDEHVRFIKGWFKDTLPGPVERLAILRLDGDMYESTIQTLEALYDHVSPGGFVIVDDYSLVGARKATDDFRAARGISEHLTHIDWTGVFWRKPVSMWR
jgi:O-methyltransferase